MTAKKPGLRKLIEERDQNILALRAQGVTLKAIAVTTNASLSTVQRVILKSNGPCGKFTPRRLNDGVEKILPLVRNGMTKAEVARHIGISINTIANWYGVAKRIAQSENPSPPQESAATEEKPNPRAILGGASLPAGHPIAVDAIWSGLEKYREPMAL